MGSSETYLLPSNVQTKKKLYEWLQQQVLLLVQDMPKKFTPEANMMIALSNVSALCFYSLNKFHDPEAKLDSSPINWLGFYLLQAPGLLGLGPFQGRPACITIRVGRGVCGTAAERKKTVVVGDVHTFPGHIACDSASNSEIVVPIISSQGGGLLGVLDIDSTRTDFFDDEDQKGLEVIVALLEQEVSYFPMKKVLTIQHSFDTVASADVPPYLLPDYAFAPSPQDPGSTLSHPHILPTTLGATGSTHEQDKRDKNPHTLTVTPLFTNIPAFRVEAKDAQQFPQVAQPQEPQGLNSTDPILREENKTVRGWNFKSVEVNSIATKEQLDALSQATGISHLPEVVYMSELEVTAPEYYNFPLFQFNIGSLLKNAKTFYTSDYYLRGVKESFRIPAFDTWRSHQNAIAVMDSRVDWAWRNTFFGLSTRCLSGSVPPGMHEAEEQDGESGTISDHHLEFIVPGTAKGTVFQLIPITKDMEEIYCINWTLLRNTKIPIVFYAFHTLFEDDLHHNGYVQCSVKIRVVEQAFFILFRYAFEIYEILDKKARGSELQKSHIEKSGEENGNDSTERSIQDENTNTETAAGIVREVRVFHEFGKSLPGKNFPMIIVQEKLTKLSPLVRGAQKLGFSQNKNPICLSTQLQEPAFSPFGNLEQRIAEGNCLKLRHFYFTDESS